MNFFLVGVGGFLGSITRYLMSGAIARFLPAAIFPWGTFAINIIGCFIIGLLAGMGATRQFLTAPMRLFLFTGILGGFTTFSAFGLESFMLFQSKHTILAILNIVGQVLLGVLMVGFGNRVGMLI